MKKTIFFLGVFVLMGCKKKEQQDTTGPESLKQWVEWVYEGDSITDTAPTIQALNYPYQLQALYSNIAAAKQVNVGFGGDQAQYMVGEYASQVHPVKPTEGQKALFFMMAGTNDAEAGRSSRQIYNDLKTEWAYAKADGFTVVALCITRATSAKRDTVAVAVNKLIVADKSKYDYLIRTDLLLPDPNDGSVFLDGLHPNDAGNILIAKEIVRVLSL